MSKHNCAIGKDYVPGSFKGVVFESTLNAEIEGGRRGAEGEFPFSEMTAYADLGRKIQRYHITAVYRNDSHIGDSQALFDACQSPGSGMLVHPTRGSVMAACKEVKVKDDPEEPGETHVEMEFVEANTVGASGALGSALFGIISTTLGTVSQGSFLDSYFPQGVSQPWRNDVIGTAQTLMSNLTAVVSQVMSSPASTAGWRAVMSTQTPTTTVVLPPQAPTIPASGWRALVSMQTTAADAGLAADAGNVDRVFNYGFNIIPNYVPDAVQRYAIFRALVNGAAALPSLDLPPDALESAQAVTLRYRVLGAIGMAEAAMAVQYSTLNDVLAALDQVTAVFQDEMAATYADCDNALYLQLRDYLIQFQGMMNTLAYRVPPVIAVNFVGGIQPLVAAYAIYRDARRFRELELRNPVGASGLFNFIINAVAPN